MDVARQIDRIGCSIVELELQKAQIQQIDATQEKLRAKVKKHKKRAEVLALKLGKTEVALGSAEVALGGLESALSAERAQNKSLQHTVACNMQDFKTLKQLHEDEIQAVQERASQSVHRYQADLEDAWGVFARLQSEHEREALVWKVKHDEHKIETAAGAERILAQSQQHIQRADETQKTCQEMQQKITKLSSKRGELEEKERAMLDLIQRQKELLMKKEEVAVELAKQMTTLAEDHERLQLANNETKSINRQLQSKLTKTSHESKKREAKMLATVTYLEEKLRILEEVSQKREQHIEHFEQVKNSQIASLEALLRHQDEGLSKCNKSLHEKEEHIRNKAAENTEKSGFLATLERDMVALEGRCATLQTALDKKSQELDETKKLISRNALERLDNILPFLDPNHKSNAFLHDDESTVFEVFPGGGEIMGDFQDTHKEDPLVRTLWKARNSISGASESHKIRELHLSTVGADQGPASITSPPSDGKGSSH